MERSTNFMKVGGRGREQAVNPEFGTFLVSLQDKWPQSQLGVSCVSQGVGPGSQFSRSLWRCLGWARMPGAQGSASLRAPPAQARCFLLANQSPRPASDTGPRILGGWPWGAGFGAYLRLMSLCHV